MKITIESICDLCGGTGAATPKTLSKQWIKGTIAVHKDPRICHENLKKRQPNPYSHE